MRTKILGIGSAVVAFVAPYLARAQFAVTTSSEVTTNGAYLNDAYARIVNMLTNTGVVTFLIVTTILAIVVWLAVNRLRHIFSS